MAGKDIRAHPLVGLGRDVNMDFRISVAGAGMSPWLRRPLSGRIW
jgi:hypothetical protein